MNLYFYAARLSLAGILFVSIVFSTGLTAQTYCESGNGPLHEEQPQQLSPESIIKRFAENESRAKAALANYAFTEEVHIQTLRNIANNGVVTDGEFRQTSDVSFDPQGKRLEHVTFAPVSTLRRVTLTPLDVEDIRTLLNFWITSQELPLYNVRYAGQQHVDQIDSYVFDVTPKTIEKNRRYFEGRIWVESREFAVVKTCGKTVPDIEATKKTTGNVFPKFVIYREQFAEHWFPTYARSDDFLFFPQGAVRIRETVKYHDYKRNLTPDTQVAAGH